MTVIDTCATYVPTSSQPQIHDFPYLMANDGTVNVDFNVVTQSCATTYTLEYKLTPTATY